MSESPKKLEKIATWQERIIFPVLAVIGGAAGFATSFLNLPLLTTQLATWFAVLATLGAVTASVVTYLGKATNSLSINKQSTRRRGKHATRRGTPAAGGQLAKGSPSGGQKLKQGAGGSSGAATPHWACVSSKGATIARYERAISALNGRANLNLGIGVALILGGVAVLAFGAYHQYKAPVDLLLRFVPRASLAGLVEVFAYFFLRMYRDNVREMRVIQRDQAHAEAQYAAVAIALRLEDKLLIDATVNALADAPAEPTPPTEVKKEDTLSVGLDKDHIEVLGQLLELFKK